MTIKAESRKEVGKKIAKKIRKQGKVPAIIYGGERESIPISILMTDLKEILKSEKKGNTILRIHRDNIQVDAMLKEIQYDYLSDNIIHVDFIRVDLNKPIVVSVPIVIKGESIGVKVEDGIFDFVTREVKLSCIPAKIPKEIEVDVSELHIGHSIKVESLQFGEDIQLISDPSSVICSVTVKGKVEEVVEEVVEEEAEEGEEGEEVTKGEETKKEPDKTDKDIKEEKPKEEKRSD